MNGIPMDPDVMDPLEVGEDMEESVVAPPMDPLASISDAILVQNVNDGYHRSREARRERQRQNDKNWKALHGQFEFLNRKQQGQSRIVIPALNVSLEQVCGTLTRQLVGPKNWFACEYETPEPPLPDLNPEVAAAILRRELDRLAIEGNYLETVYGSHRLVYDSLKVGLIESVVTWKVTIADIERQVYDFPPGYDLEMHGFVGEEAPPQVVTKTEKRLKVEIVPFADHYPDPSPSSMFDIHEVEVPVSALPDLGFDDEMIQKMRGNLSTEKEEQRKVRAGNATSLSASKDRVLLREYWGNVVDPNTGKMLARNVVYTTCGSLVVKRPQFIAALLWHGRRPFITVPLIPTPLSHVHKAFLDIAVPLVETESELTNLVIDGGFSSIHGIKEIREYMLENPSVLSNGLVNGLVLSVAEGYGDSDVVKQVETGTLAPETLSVLDRIMAMRQEAFSVSDLQLGRLPARKESATAVTEAAESADNLYSSIAGRFEDNGIEVLIELCWLTMWQFLDEFDGPLAAILGPEYAQIMQAMAPQERFVVMANGVRFKATGFKGQQAAVKDSQKLITLQNFIGQNPALLDVWQQEFSPTKQFQLLYRALGVDPTELRRGPEEPYMNPALLQGAAGNPATAPGLAADGESVAPPNATGFRGVQAP